MPELGASQDLWRSEVRGEIARKGRWSELFLHAFGGKAEVFILSLSLQKYYAKQNQGFSFDIFRCREEFNTHSEIHFVL